VWSAVSSWVVAFPRTGPLRVGNEHGENSLVSSIRINVSRLESFLRLELELCIIVAIFVCLVKHTLHLGNIVYFSIRLQ